VAQRYSLDVQTLVELQEDRHAAATRVYQGISNTTGITSFMVPATVLAAGLIKNDNATIKKGFYIAESIFASELITYGLKYSVKRQRPFEENKFITSATGTVVRTPSFPSGHTSDAFSTATALTIAYPKWYVAVPAYLWAGSVGFSRMYLGVHYPTDVLAGAVVGAGSAWLMYKANKWLFKKKPQVMPQF
jgi:undecaprenyl-diphosphatase